MVTNEQGKRFGRVKAGYEPIEHKPKPKYGSIWVDGVLYRENLPFPLLQHIRNQLVREGYSKKRIRIGYFTTK